MSSRNPAPAFRESGEDMFQELIMKLNRFILPNNIQLGQIRGFGGFAEVFEADMHVSETGEARKVAVKRFRVVLRTATDFVKSLKREVLLWKQLDHKNILPLIGITLIEGVPCTVSEWMENGTMDTYLGNHTEVDILELIKGVACGLEYLHMRGIVHSDLKTDNVLISHDRRPVLSDFGLSRLQLDSITLAGTTTLRGNARWMALELIQAPNGSSNQMHTKATDVWAFGMVTYQALSGKIPFYEFAIEVQVLMAIINKQAPSRPDDSRIERRVFELLWKCCTDCWSYDPNRRPTMAQVRRHLRVKRTLTIETVSKISASWCMMSPTGRFLAIRSENLRSILFVDSKTMNRCGLGLSLDFGIYELAWSSTEDQIIVRSSDEILRKWSNILESPILVAQSTQGHYNASLGFSPDDRFIASFYDSAKIWDASNLSLIWEYPGYWSCMAFHPMGHRLIFYQKPSLLDVSIKSLGNITATELQINHDVYDFVFYPSGTICVAGSEHGVKILSADTFEEKYALPYDDFRAMRITPNGKYVLVVLASKNVVLWDVATKEAIEELSLDVDDSCYGEISRNCRVLRLRNTPNNHFVHFAWTHD